MELPELIAALSRPAAWPVPVDRVDVVQTHISVVFLVGAFAYKLKKPVDLGFLDQRSLAAREGYCRAELRLNRPFAPGVYLDVVPVARAGDALRVEGPGEPVDWLVKMARLPDDRSLLARVEAGTADAALLARVGRRVAELHRAAARSPAIAALAAPDAIAVNARENFDQTAAHVGLTVEEPVWERLRALTEAALADRRDTFARRAPAACDGHGDLRLEHVYLLDDDRILLVDGIEFSDRFRWADPASDVAFLAMDLAVRDRRDLAEALLAAWTDATGDGDAREVLPFYLAYRSIVRAKVAGFQLGEAEIPADRRARALSRARRHWLYALGVLEAPGRRPALLGVGGLPGTGKSTLSRGLAELAGFTVIRSDVVRKELAGLALTDHPKVGYEQGLYTPQAKDEVYAACVDRARAALLAGERVIVDASLSRDRWRADLLALGRELAVPALLLTCEAPPDVVHARLDARGEDPSDASWAVYQAAASRFQAPTELTRPAWIAIDAGDRPEDTVARGLDALRARALA